MLGDLAATGFGTVTMDLGRALLEQGVDIRFLSQNDLVALPEPFYSRTADEKSIISTLNPVTGQLEANEANTILGQFITGQTRAMLTNGEPWGEWAPDAVIMLGDYRAAEILYERDPDAFGDVPAFHYCPIEGVGLPPAWMRLWQRVRPIAMTTFGQLEMAKVIGYMPPMVYHGVDASVFHPVTAQTPISLPADGRPDVSLTSKHQCKQAWAAWFGVPVGKKWILRTDRHMPRKRYNSMLRALVPVLERQPDVSLIIHCGSNDQGGNLYDALSKFGAVLINDPSEERPQSAWALPGRGHGQILLTDSPGLARPALVSLYNAADLYVSTSAEGFGLTIAEAIACGVPAVAMDYSAVPEVVGPAGVCVPIADLVENEYDHYWAAVDEMEFGRRVEFLITHQSRREDLGRKGPAHVTANFSWDRAASAFITVLHDAVVTHQAA